ncbi:MAG TPA: hypothetical protein VGR21_12795 [Cryptosporangiaceae bacterium]|nr:hypothetical protein [Cryptosporangiaceae bacterium]
MGRHASDEDRPGSLDTDLDSDQEAFADSPDDETELDEDEPGGATDVLAAQFWDEVGIAPIEIALPKGVGYTLREYRTVTVVVPAAGDLDADEVDDELDADDFADADELDEDDDLEDEDAPAADATDAETETAEEAVFLATDGRLHLFRSAEGLVEFVRSDAPHDLTTAEGWDALVAGIEPEFVSPEDEDRYELDLVVANLRGGRDAWDADLLIGAGEIARDVAFGCRLNDVLAALAPGTPLDTMDEALRDGGFLARRRLRKIGPDQAALAWRSVIGKISTAVEWHD